jgi:DNA-binding NarL/FixJ family response regulator
MRGSLRVLRELRGQIQEHRGVVAPESRNGTQADSNGHLQLQYGLTAREQAVAVLLAQGRSNAAIAEALQISTHTARHHTQRILAKLGVHSRAAAGAQLRGGWEKSNGRSS